MRPELQKKIDSAIRLLRAVGEHYDGEIEIAYSGGKDSDVILQLAKEAGIRYRAIYKNTTIDPPGTIKHVEEMGVEIVRPKKSFFQLVAERGFPSRWARFCCSELKEYKILDKVIMGVRKEESIKRAQRYHEPTECRVYRSGGRVEAIYPILEWTLADVEEFVKERHLTLAPHYYREDGSIDFTRRLGCMACPLTSRNHRIEEFMNHPQLLRAYLRNGKKWWDAKPRAGHKHCSDVYEYFACKLFADGTSTRVLNKDSLFKTDYKQALENYFHVKL